MKFGDVHRAMILTLASLGLLSLVTSGSLNTISIGAIVIGLIAVLFLPDRYQISDLEQRLGSALAIGLFATQIARVTIGGTSFIVAAFEFTAGLQIIRLATRRGAAHDQQIVLLALLHLVAGTILGGGLAFAGCFLAFLAVAPGALLLSHLRREVEGNYRQGARDRTGLPVDVPRILRSRRVISRRFLLITCALAVPIFAFTGMLFLFFPRVGLSWIFLHGPQQERLIGFSDHVELGKVGALRADMTLALRVHLPNVANPPQQRVPLYLRGTAFDTYDGRSWRRDRTQGPASQRGRTIDVSATDHAQPELMTLDLEPLKPSVLFLPLETTNFELLPGPDSLVTSITEGFDHNFEYSSPADLGLRYRVYGRPPRTPIFEHTSPGDFARYLTLPPDMPQRVVDLARTWTDGSTDTRQIARQVESHLRHDYKYDLNSPAGEAANPLDDFLFVSRRGHCEFYSTSMAIMLRTLGIPARNVTGFIAGTYNPFGKFYAVRQGDAHSWVEVWLPREGWTRFDPTPSSETDPNESNRRLASLVRDLVDAAAEHWDRSVVGYDLGQQMKLVERLTKGLPNSGSVSTRSKIAAASILALLALGWFSVRFFRSRRRPTRGPESASLSDRQLERVVLAYRKLEETLNARGVPRQLSVPPLSHARALVALGHPLAETTLELTQIYQSARYGNVEFNAEAETAFLAKVNELRRTPLSDAA